ncbi:hypothetical protein SISSUDRAFT_1058657 [Sistotremastrum suecicum HHB10207 ss-3]|uniref:Uncharacterized protein n=1 Tax=Sistotremastrum suecicum HHB10207 ss-3 TaxID=1314776 RepID=A0A166H390_9AGAM|nr:hypothetical protein SISSUDRAFT_1058657 [Sistotremastrum suecicum HHB10207 ss-3]
MNSLILALVFNVLGYHVGSAASTPLSASTQHIFHSPSLDSAAHNTWSLPPPTNSTANHIFSSVDSLLKHWHNTIYRNGHAFVVGTVPSGTVLYHGRSAEIPPYTPEWLAFDFEHSFVFSTWGQTAWMVTYVVDTPLKIGYYDGNSAAKLPNGSMDVQDLLIWGVAEANNTWREWERIVDMCEWGEPLGLHGFVRMEVSFELMLCDFSKNVRIISHSELVPSNLTMPRRPPRNDSEESDHFGLETGYHLPSMGERQLDGPGKRPMPPPGPFPPDKREPPVGWRGTLRNSESVRIEAFRAGSWHNLFAESRVHLDLTRYVTLFDPKYSSLFSTRTNQTRMTMRGGGASVADIAQFRADVEYALTRPDNISTSGVNWQDLARVIVERFGDRLDYLNYTLNLIDTTMDERIIAARVRTQVLALLAPYLLTSALPFNTSYPDIDISWAKPIHEKCSQTLIPDYPDSSFLPNELVLRNSFLGVTTEICRVVTLIWTGALDIEAQDKSVVIQKLHKWRMYTNDLLDWLGWAHLIRCKPACKDDAFCYVPTWSVQRDLSDMTPRCMHRDDPWDTLPLDL